MTNYNDGNWHVWDGRDGDKCPVNPDCRIDLQYWQGPGYTNDRAGHHDWQGPLMFRATRATDSAELLEALGLLLQVQDGLPMTGTEATRRAENARAILAKARASQ